MHSVRSPPPGARPRSPGRTSAIRREAFGTTASTRATCQPCSVRIGPMIAPIAASKSASSNGPLSSPRWTSPRTPPSTALPASIDSVAAMAPIASPAASRSMTRWADASSASRTWRTRRPPVMYQIAISVVVGPNVVLIDGDGRCHQFDEGRHARCHHRPRRSRLTLRSAGRTGDPAVRASWTRTASVTSSRTIHRRMPAGWTPVVRRKMPPARSPAHLLAGARSRCDIGICRRRRPRRVACPTGRLDRPGAPRPSPRSTLDPADGDALDEEPLREDEDDDDRRPRSASHAAISRL